MHRRACALALLLAATACTGSDPAATPGTLPSPPAPPPATAAAPKPNLPAVVKPPGADEATSAGAALFVRYWFRELSHAYQGGDPRRLDKASSAKCQTCQNYLRSLAADRRKEYKYSGGRINVKEAIAPAVTSDSVSVLVRIDEGGLVVSDARGAVVARVPGVRNQRIRFDLVRSGSRWQAQGVFNFS